MENHEYLVTYTRMYDCDKNIAGYWWVCKVVRKDVAGYKLHHSVGECWKEERGWKAVTQDGHTASALRRKDAVELAVEREHRARRLREL